MLFGQNFGGNGAADDDDQLPLSERAKKLKGKDVLPPTKTSEDPILSPEKVGTKPGPLALLERALKLKKKKKKKIEAYVAGLQWSHFMINSVHSVECEPMNPPSLVFPMRTLEEKRSNIIHVDLARLFRMLKRTPLDGAKVI